MDEDSVRVEDGSQIYENEDISPCILCDRTDAQTSLKCCLKFLCFKCYNKMARSGRTLACPHCRENPLQFYDESDDSSDEDTDSNLSPTGNERTVHVIDGPRPTDTLSHESIQLIRRFYVINQGQNSFHPHLSMPNLTMRLNTSDNSSEPPLVNKIVIGVQSAFFLLQFIIYYFLPKWSVTAFFIGFGLGIFDISFITKFIIYPIIYPMHIFHTYINKTVVWRYIKRIDLTENRI